MNDLSFLRLRNGASVRGLLRALLMAALLACGGRLLFGQSVPALINYQGRLTDAEGAALPNGSYRVAFKLWTEPLAGAPGDRLIWGREYGVTLLDGQFHVILGDGGTPVTDAAVNDLGFAFSEAARFLGLTVLETPSGRPAPPREIVPRQQILSVPFALNAGNARVADGVAPGAITGASLATNIIQGLHLMPGSVDPRKLVPRTRGTNVPAGGIAVSLPVADQTLTGSSYEKIQNLAVTIETTGRPVMIFLAPPVLTNVPATPAETPPSLLYFLVSPGADLGRFRLLRNGGQAAITAAFGSGAGGSTSVGYQTVLGPLIDFPGPGTHRYELEWGFQSSGGLRARIYNQVLVAFEL